MRIIGIFLSLAGAALAVLYLNDPNYTDIACDQQESLFKLEEQNSIVCCAVCGFHNNCSGVIVNTDENTCTGCSSGLTSTSASSVPSNGSSSIYYKKVKTHLLSNTTTNINITTAAVTTTPTPVSMTSISTHIMTKPTTSQAPITIQSTASQSDPSTTMPTTSYQPLVEIRKTMPMDTGKQADSDNWHTFEGKSYKFIDLKMKRAQALMYCKSESGRMAGLVIIDRKEQNEFVKNLAFKDNTDHTTIHMGLRFREHKITIEFTQVVVSYDNFDEDHVSAIMAGTGDECIYMERSGYWVTGVCDSDDNYQFVCWV